MSAATTNHSEMPAGMEPVRGIRLLMVDNYD